MRAGASGATLALFAAGASAFVGAQLYAATPLGALLGVSALAVACLGFGFAWGRCTRDELPLGATLVVGLALLLTSSTLLAHVGWLTRNVQLGFVAAGIVATISRNGEARRSVSTLSPFLVGFVTVSAVTLIGCKLAELTPTIVDGTQQTMAVKRLWDTGSLPALTHPGALIVAESYASLHGVAALTGMFEAGFAPAVLILMLATMLPDQRSPTALVLLLIVAVPIVVNTEPSIDAATRWSGTLLHATIILALLTIANTRRWSAHLVPCAIALVAMRWELALLALSYALGAAWLVSDRPVVRWKLVVGSSAWLVVLALVSGPSIRALTLSLVVTLAAVIAAYVVTALFGALSPRSPLPVMIFACTVTSLAKALRLLPSVEVTAGLTSIVWFGATLGFIALLEYKDISPERRVSAITAIGVLTMFAAIQVIWPTMVESRRRGIRERYLDVVSNWGYVLAHGYHSPIDDAARALQEHAPRGASIGVWAASVGHLDFKRNHIEDLAWSRGGRMQLRAQQLARLDYVIVEDILARPSKRREPDPWGTTLASPTAHHVQELELVESRGAIRLYRVTR